jgi:hypothetical protein
MDIITHAAQSGNIYLLQAPRKLSRRIMNELAAHLVLEGPVQVLDGGNFLDAYTIARLVRRRTHHLEAVLEQLGVARAFTCYQMVSLLAAQPERPIPVLAFGLLTTFRDENVPLAERRLMLERCLDHIRRLSRKAPVVINACSLSDDSLERWTYAPATGRAAAAIAPEEMLPRLAEIAGQVWRFEAPELVTQPRLL